MRGGPCVVGVASLIVAAGCRPSASDQSRQVASASASAPVAPPQAQAASPAPSASVDAGIAAAWVGTFRATTSDPFVDDERKTRYRTRHVLASIARDGSFRLQMTPSPVDDFDAQRGCETRGHLERRDQALFAIEDATTCPPIAKLPRAVALKIEQVDRCLLRWVHPSGGLSGGVLELGLRKRDCT